MPIEKNGEKYTFDEVITDDARFLCMDVQLKQAVGKSVCDLF